MFLAVSRFNWVLKGRLTGEGRGRQAERGAPKANRVEASVGERIQVNMVGARQIQGIVKVTGSSGYNSMESERGGSAGAYW
jgi:hypothetical protein